jgi:hypothetical protein
VKISRVCFDDLPEVEQENASDNGCGKEDAGYLRVEMPGRLTRYFSDAMEPEDASFGRDLKWVAEAIEDAFVCGANMTTPKETTP